MANSKFHHEEIYRGKELLAKLSTMHLTICGAGAIGSNLTENLARQGFSAIRLIDFDRVETHNISTQTFEEVDVGATKVRAVQDRIFRTVGIEIETVDKELKQSNAKKLLRGSDLVVDGFDNNKSRQLLQDYCRKADIPCFHVGLHADYGEAVWDKVYKVPEDVDGDICDYPLARNLIMLTVGIASEEVLDYCLADAPRMQSWCITLKDLRIGNYC